MSPKIMSENDSGANLTLILVISRSSGPSVNSPVSPPILYLIPLISFLFVGVLADLSNNISIVLGYRRPSRRVFDSEQRYDKNKRTEIYE
jgi:hypothetical protein